MLVNRFALIAVTLILGIVLMFALDNILLGGGLTFLIVVGGYVIIALVKTHQRVGLLYRECDPQKFIEATEKNLKNAGKNQPFYASMQIDIAAGLIEQGKFREAKKKLTAIDRKYLSLTNGTLLAYTINLILCHYGLGEVKEAEALYESQLPLMAPVRKSMQLHIEILMAVRLYRLKRFEEAKEKCQELLGKKLEPIQRAHLHYVLGEMAELEGDFAAAKSNYEFVVRTGNQLWIVTQAQKKLDSF